MSVQPYPTKDGTRWRVRWRENGVMHSVSFTSRSEANAKDAEVRAKLYRGEVIPRPTKQTLAAFYEDWMRRRGPALAEATRRSYQATWDAHIRDALGAYSLRELSQRWELIEDFIADLRAQGVGLPTRRKCLVVLQAMFRSAEKRRLVERNPVKLVDKEKLAKPERVRPWPPIVVERIRAQLRARVSKDGSGTRPLGDALLVSVMAYAGLRPQEALALEWGDVQQQTLVVTRAVSFGSRKGTKTGEPRTVPLARALADDLAEWRAASGNPPDHALVFPGSTGELWSHAAYNNWRGRIWRPAVQAVAEADARLAPLAEARPYDCRHSFVSLNLRAGVEPLVVAARAGHSQAVMFGHYTHIINDLVGAKDVDVDRQIELARELVMTRPEAEVNAAVAVNFLEPTKSVSELSSQLFAPRGPDRQ